MVYARSNSYFNFFISDSLCLARFSLFSTVVEREYLTGRELGSVELVKAFIFYCKFLMTESLFSHSLVFSFRYSFSLIFSLSRPSMLNLSCYFSIPDSLSSLIY